MTERGELQKSIENLKKALEAARKAGQEIAKKKGKGGD